MNYSVYNENQWLFPDTPHSDLKAATLHVAKNAHTGFAILGDDGVKNKKITAKVLWHTKSAPKAEIFQLLSVGVDENTASTLMTTTDYSTCKDFVTRQAPFRVYDALRPLDGQPMREDRLALFVRIETSVRSIQGEHKGTLMVEIDGESIAVPFTCTVHKAVVPPLKKASLGVMNFCYFENIAIQHNVEMGSEEYWQLFRKYVAMLIKLRSTHITVPSGTPIRDENGQVIGFDFSLAEKLGSIALEEGVPFICGANFAHWKDWDDKDYYLGWDSEVSTLSVEGYLQLKLYFEKWASIVKRNNWQKVVTQSLADEPQIHNDTTYRALAAVCRKFLPGVKIIDAVETINLGGGIDIWVPKQDTFEKEKDKFDKLRLAGEEMWFYTCAFPAGKIMNRSMDIPLLASREVLWMGFGYHLSGFLHWGLNFYIGDDIWSKACCPHKGKLLPAGDAHIVYPDGDNVLASMRLHVQSAGAQDFELLTMLEKIDGEKAQNIREKVCTSFRDYETNGEKFSIAQAELLCALD